jgi:TPR repeat protein
MNGRGVSVDFVQSAYYLKLAEVQACADAIVGYCIFLMNGKGVSVDFVRSAYYLKLAADQGIAQAQF